MYCSAGLDARLVYTVELHRRRNALLNKVGDADRVMAAILAYQLFTPALSLLADSVLSCGSNQLPQYLQQPFSRLLSSCKLAGRRHSTRIAGTSRKISLHCRPGEKVQKVIHRMLVGY